MIDQLAATGTLNPRAEQALRVLVHELGCSEAADFVFERYYPYLAGLESIAEQP